MAYAERRGNLFRARWRRADGSLDGLSGFQDEDSALQHARDQEALIRNNVYIDHRAGQITLNAWVDLWYSAQDLELSTLDNYKYLIECHILPEFGDAPLNSLTREGILRWRKGIVDRGFAKSTADSARSLLGNIFNDAIPRYIQVNPAAQRRGKGRKGIKRIQRIEQAEKVWATPLQALLIAERCATLSGYDTDFVLVITLAYTGMRWSEIIGLRPEFVTADQIKVDWKLYEKGRFYLGHPKDGSRRTLYPPPFLRDLLRDFITDNPPRLCTCRNSSPPWCQGERYVFLGPNCGHFRRSDYSEGAIRPASDGWHPERHGQRNKRPSMPVLVDTSGPFPGMPLVPWQAAVPDESYAPRRGRGVPQLITDDRTGRCAVCRRTVPRRRNGMLIYHKRMGTRCDGSYCEPAEDLRVASWLPVLAGLTPHGLRHGHETWMEESGIREVLQDECMGHETAGMRGVYVHITQSMRDDLAADLERRWIESLAQRAAIAPTSAVPVLNRLLGDLHGDPNPLIHSHFAPRIGH